MTLRGIRTKPEPWCPKCGARMVLKRPQPYQSWQAFWGCMQYPECRGTRGIDGEGNPVLYEEADE